MSMEDSIPATLDGQIVSLADKLDTLRGCFGIGLIPTGSKDPFALRRAAQGVVKILVEGKLARCALCATLHRRRRATARSFFLDRVRYYFRDVRGFAYDEVNAVLAAGWDDLWMSKRGWSPFKRSGRPRTSSRWRPASSASGTS